MKMKTYYPDEFAMARRITELETQNAELLEAAKALSACAETEYWSSEECRGLHLLRQALVKAETNLSK